MLTFDAVSDMLANVNLAATTQTVLATDSASSANGNSDGVSFCGPRAYSIDATSPPVLGLTGNTLSLVSTDPADVTISPISITITAKLVNYPSITSTLNFLIEVEDLCESTLLTFAPVSDMIAYVNSVTTTET